MKRNRAQNTLEACFWVTLWVLVTMLAGCAWTPDYSWTERGGEYAEPVR